MKRVAKKTATKKAAGKRAAAKPRDGGAIQRSLVGYRTVGETGLVIPAKAVPLATEVGVVAADKLKAGLAQAQKRIRELLQEMVDTATDDYEIAEIELSASFSADGKFMGFGVGGQASIVFRIRPCRPEGVRNARHLD